MMHTYQQHAIVCFKENVMFKVCDAVWSNVMGDGNWREHDKEPKIFLKGVE